MELKICEMANLRITGCRKSIFTQKSKRKTRDFRTIIDKNIKL